ncbi:hypothetical protein IFR04_014794, partial [Cadophora malorum]
MDKQHFLTNTSEHFYDERNFLFTDRDEAMHLIHGSLWCQYSTTQDLDSSLSKVSSVSDQGCDWSPFGDALSMCRSSADGDAYDASMMSRDAQGFFCERCGMWAVSKISQDMGLKSSWICESCEKAAGSFAFVDFGQVNYLYSGTTEANGDVTVGQQLVQYSIPSIDQSAIFTTDMTGHFPMFEGQCADNLFSNGAYVSEDFLFSNDLYASTNSLVLPEKKVPRA